MRAVVVDAYTTTDVLRIQSVSKPDVTSGHVIVDIAAAGLGFVDGMKVGGLYQTKDPLPFIPGMEFAGTISQVGDGVDQGMIGQRVFGLVPRGALAEQIALPADRLLKVPSNISFAQAAAVPINYLTALYALKERAAIRPGELLLVLGAAGGTGTAAIKVGKMLGAEIIAAASTEEKRALALSEGAHLAIDHTQPDWRETLKGLTRGRGIDVIFDVVGGSISPIAFRTLGWKGRHLVVGFAAGTIPALSYNIALLKGASLVGIDSAQIEKWEPSTYATLLSDIESGLALGALEPPPVQTFAFEEFRRAFDVMAERQATGKVVILPSI